MAKLLPIQKLPARVWVILICTILLAATITAFLINDGMISIFPTIDEGNRPRINVWRNGCDPILLNEMNTPAFAGVTTDARQTDYLRSHLPGELSLSFDGFFDNCSSVGIDLRELGAPSVVSATANIYNPALPGEGVRTINTTPIPLSIDEDLPGTAFIGLPPEGDIARLKLKVAPLLLRSSMTEFYFNAHISFTSQALHSDLRPNPEIEVQNLGGTFPRLTAIGLRQTTRAPNAHFGGAPEIIRTIQFRDLESVNRFISTALATLLGLWVGLAAESVLALTILREVRSTLSSKVNRDSKEEATSVKSVPTETVEASSANQDNSEHQQSNPVDATSKK